MVTFEPAVRRRTAAVPAGRVAPRGAADPTSAARVQVRQALQIARVQPKLTVGPPDDEYEREADRVADQVMRMPASVAASAAATPPEVQRKCKACEEEETVQRLCTECEDEVQATPANGEHDVQLDPAPASVGDVLAGSGRPLDPALRQDMEARFGHDFSRVRVHSGAGAERSARDVNAQAYTVGHNIVFGAGRFAPETYEGRRLIAHELAHTVQSSSGAPQGRLHRRRVPAAAGLGAAVPTAGVGLVRARTGLARTLSRAWAGLNAGQRSTVQTAAAGFGISFVAEADLLTRLESATRAQLLSFAQAIRTAAPTAELRDPLLIDVGARPGTSDAAHITTLVNNAAVIFTTIAGGFRDADLTQVFGAANVAAAKIKYANAHTRMNQLKAADKIVTDRSGYSAEVGLGGLSDSSQIAVSPSTIDNPGADESVITLIHESMHAGNNDVHDFGYIDQPSFTALAASVKLTNAAHYEVVPRRILGASHAFAGQTFVPAGTTVGGVTAPALTPREQAIRDASETFREAWSVGLNLHTLFVRVFRTPTEWNTLDLSAHFSGAPAGAHFADTLPFWSKVEMLTIHTRAGSINPAGVAAVRPMTLIDIALSEGLIRKLSQGMNAVPQTPPAAQAFETAHASAAELTAAAASVNAERDLLIRLVIRVNLGSVTGAVNRDERVVARLAQAGAVADFSDILAVRPPSAFP